MGVEPIQYVLPAAAQRTVQPGRDQRGPSRHTFAGCLSTNEKSPLILSRISGPHLVWVARQLATGGTMAKMPQRCQCGIWQICQNSGMSETACIVAEFIGRALQGSCYLASECDGRRVFSTHNTIDLSGISVRGSCKICLRHAQFIKSRLDKASHVTTNLQVLFVYHGLHSCMLPGTSMPVNVLIEDLFQRLLSPCHRRTSQRSMMDCQLGLEPIARRFDFECS